MDITGFLGGTDFVAVSFGGGAVLGAIFVATRRSSYRCATAGSWIALCTIGALPALAGFPLAHLAGVDNEAWYSPAIVSFIAELLGIHILLPAAAPDFQTSDIGASAGLAAVMTLPTLAAGFMFIHNAAAVPT